MARTYKRDSRGRFAGGGGGSGGGGGRGPVKVGRSGPRGGKVGTRTEQRRNAKAQADRTKKFSSKAAPNAAKDAYKAAASKQRGAATRAARRTQFNQKTTVGRSAKKAYRKAESQARYDRQNLRVGGTKADLIASRARLLQMEATRRTSGKGKRKSA